jgi:hypothetical protein
MATKPITCPYLEGEGFKFYRSNLVFDDGKSTNLPIYMELSDMLQETTGFSKSKVNLRAGKCFLLSQNDIGNKLGYVSFILVKAIFPNNIVESRKYLEWTYMGKTYPMGELLALSGMMLSATDSIYEGWLLAKPNEYSDLGGIVFCNTQSDIDIKLEILVCN